LIEKVNITLYIILSVICYLMLIALSMYNINTFFRGFVDSLVQKLSKIGFFAIVQKFFTERVLKFIRLLASTMIKLLYEVSGFFCKLDDLLQRSDRLVLTEPVNLTALAVRKLYGENINLMLAAAAGIIVVFYFILTIF
jgi:hypothetical protein